MSDRAAGGQAQNKAAHADLLGSRVDSAMDERTCVAYG